MDRLARLIKKQPTPDEFDTLCVEVFQDYEPGKRLLTLLDARYNNVELFDKDSERATSFALGRRSLVLEFFKGIARETTKGVK